MNEAKVYVTVNVDFTAEGTLLPREITWEDGRAYLIDCITDVRPAPAERAGGWGIRYTVRIDGRQSYLFFERAERRTGNDFGRWFVERRNA